MIDPGHTHDRGVRDYDNLPRKESELNKGMYVVG